MAYYAATAIYRQMRSSCDALYVHFVNIVIKHDMQVILSVNLYR